eukprot:31030-Pelagococcus_subviridis.AAC.5
MTDLAVPLLPEIAIPPSAGSIAPSRSADLMFSWPMTAASGNVWRKLLFSTVPMASIDICSSSIAAATRAAASESDATAADGAIGLRARAGRADGRARSARALPAIDERRAAGGAGGAVGRDRRRRSRVDKCAARAIFSPRWTRGRDGARAAARTEIARAHPRGASASPSQRTWPPRSCFGRGRECFREKNRAENLEDQDLAICGDAATRLAEKPVYEFSRIL